MAMDLRIKESFLYYIWKTKSFDFNNLEVGDKAIIIEDFGIQNHDSGPDFSDVRIRINDILWAGSVEMHIKSSDWVRHKHHKDAAYNKVILHIVYEHDQEIYNEKNDLVPTIALKDRIHKKVLDRYHLLMYGENFIPCQNLIAFTPDIVKSLTLENCGIERIIQKSTAILLLLEKNNGDWEKTMLTTLFRYFGAKVNGNPFERLAISIPFNLLSKLSDDITAIEALLFGQAGLLYESHRDPYIMKLYKEYNFLKHKHDLNPLDPSVWKFSRMRPSNFPTIRIAQLAQILIRENHLFSAFLSHTYEDDMLLLDVTASTYWYDHYRFGKVSNKGSSKRIGRQFKHSILINVVAPVLFAYGMHLDAQKHKHKAIELLSDIPAENISKVKKWSETADYTLASALQSQAVIQLLSNYCTSSGCLNCRIGNHILSK